MAENKTSFVLYSDQRSVIDMLSNEQAGLLLKHIYYYVNDENPTLEDLSLKLAFEPIKLQLKRDLKKWETIKDKRSDAGKASAEARKQQKEQAEQTSTKSTSVKSVQQTSTNPTVNDNVNVNVNDTVINKKVDSNESLFNLFWSKYPKKVAKDKCKAKFLKLKQTDIDKILSSIDSFIKYKPFDTYTHPNPETYLNQKRWEDETPTITNEPKTTEQLYYENVMKQMEINKNS